MGGSALQREQELYTVETWSLHSLLALCPNTAYLYITNYGYTLDNVAPPTTVTDPCSSLSQAENSNGNTPPIFLDGTNMKKKYANELRVSMEIMESYSSSEKTKFKRAMTELNSYPKWDEQSSNVLDEARSSRELNLKGEIEKDLLTELVEKVNSLVATESVPERKNKMVMILSDISSCFTLEGETTAHFVMRCKKLTHSH